ncbi:4Fe-4S binding protein [Paludicola sp. MB14-C6]|uniref:4Fe-4S binding protein n=1 Tax=Paludihabitans sp. MB14-C6 TaxID=3070656 RepID=UPI0027DBF427|nr:4Fe-4S binding protein [Paludicola sp. MB14-C6]WMJ22782.1 4Fe-4S binding protein [Paludicola sp. MB14-C6]
MGKLTIDYEKCKGCSMCVVACPKKILEINKNKLNLKGYNPVDIIDREKCISCAMCATMCPDCVITIEND